MKVASFDPPRFEPTVFGAMRRYIVMVIVAALLVAAAAVGYTVLQGKSYRAQAGISVPLPTSAPNQNAAQYLDSQVLLMQSQGVAQQAAVIADKALGGTPLSVHNFSGSGSSLTITPPAGAAPGVYGASIINVSFSAASARTAQVATNALLQAFDQARSAAIVAQANLTIAGIDRAINSTSSQTQQTTLLTQRTQTIINEKQDLAATPTVSWATRPTKPSSGGLKQRAAIGLVIGILLGAVLAYARASRRRGFTDRRDPAALYGVPLIGEIPAFESEKTPWSNGKRAHASLPMIASPHSRVAEAFRFTAGAVERIQAQHGSRLALAFVSPLAGSGKSVVVANLALAIAEGGASVLVVDGDGHASAQLLCGKPATDGLKHVLTETGDLEDFVQASQFGPRIHVLRSVPASGQVRSKAAKALLAEAKKRYDIVLIDSPALLGVARAAELVDASDAAIIVLSAKEPIQDHIEVVERLSLIGCDVAGYIYDHMPMRPGSGRFRRYDVAIQAAMAPVPVLSSDQSLNGKDRPPVAHQPQR
jgi:Mrp family chromosome partitioning ATPase